MKTYQIMGTTETNFSDREIVQELYCSARLMKFVIKGPGEASAGEIRQQRITEA